MRLSVKIVYRKRLTGNPKTANISALLQARFHTEQESNVRSI